MKNKTILFAVGGSGGHLFPAIEIAKVCQSLGFDLIFCGVDLERNPFFLKEQFKFKSVSGSAIDLKNPLKKIFLIVKGIVQSLFFLKNNKPDLVIGFGSFHSFPAVFASAILNIPFFLFEPNLSLGKVNRFMYFKARKILSYFGNDLPKQIQIFPVKSYKKMSPDLVKSQFNIPIEKQVLLIVGGSQGSKILNEAILKIDPEILKPFYVIHIAGKNENLKRLEDHYTHHAIQAFVLDFSSQMELFLSIADCAITRAGASSLIESIEYQIPTLFIPYGLDQKGHQYENAKYFCEFLKGGLLLNQNMLAKEIIDHFVTSLFDQRQFLKENLKNYRIDSDRKRVESVILEFLGDK